MKKLLLFLSVVGIAAAEPKTRAPSPLLAVIEVVNNSGEHQAFVSGMPDMLITELLQGGGIQLVERTKIKTAMEALKIEASGITDESNLALGKWLGADGIIVGAFNKLDQKYRLDIRVIDVKTGTISFASSSTQTKQNLIDLIPRVGAELRRKLTPELTEKNKRLVAGNHLSDEKKSRARVQIQFKMIVGVFAEVAIPHQKIRVYLNENLIHTSRVIDELNQYFTVLDQEISPGEYTLKLVHGTVNSDGSWRESLEEQPESFSFRVRPRERVSLKYKMRAEDRWNSFSRLKFRS